MYHYLVFAKWKMKKKELIFSDGIIVSMLYILVISNVRVLFVFLVA